MIVSHLVYIGNRYPVAEVFVYIFHMPGFLIISGYLPNVHKLVPQFLRYIQWILVPYLLMESGYVVMASILPTREHIQQLTFGLFLEKLFLHPLGPYWYLHTLTLCGIVTYVIAQSAGRHRVLMLLGVLLCLQVLILLGLVTWVSAVYFYVSVALRLSHRPFVDTFHPTWWSFIGVVLVVTCVPNALQRRTIGGMPIVYLVISFLLWLYPYLPREVARISHFIGRNSLILLLFSPMFTVLSKLFQSYLLFEPSGVLFMLVVLLFTVVDSFAVACALQKLHIARYMFGQLRIIK